MNSIMTEPVSPEQKYQLYDMEVRSFDRYAMAKYDLLKEWLSPYKNLKILSIGCGSGELSHMLAMSGHEVFGIDVDSKYVEMASKKARELKLSNCSFKTSSIEEFETDQFYDAVLSTDVLEHLENDEQMLEKMVSFLKPDGLMIVTVPAGPYLYGHHDSSLKHYRRYSKSSLSKIVGRFIRIIHIRYFGFFLIPITILYSQILKKMYPVEIGKLPQSSLRFKLMNAVLALEKKIKFPLGTGLLVMGKVKEKKSMETLRECVLCHGNDRFFKEYGIKQNYRIVRCENCGLVFVNPRDDQNVILSQYEEDMTSPISYYKSTAKADAVNFVRKLDLIEKRLPKGKLLDIGCSVGTFLDVAKTKGWDVAGLEANKKACEICRNKGLKIYEGFFTDELIKALKQEQFDLVCMFDSIEHFPDPLKTLQLVARLMPQNGFLALSTPNIGSLLGRIFQIKPKEHLFYFDRSSLAKILEKAGLEIVFVKEMKRRRDVGAMHLGASLNKKWLMISKFLSVTGMHFPVSLLLETFFREELFALARKTK